MKEASAALVERRYFDCERLAADALRRAIAAAEFDRTARIIMPLQEARRQIRDLAVDSARLVVVDGVVPSGPELVPGMYLISPPRVGADGRLIREEALRREIPVVVVAREPMTLQGLWPVVAIGPVTIRTRISPPDQPTRHAEPHAQTAPAKPIKPRGKGHATPRSHPAAAQVSSPDSGHNRMDVERVRGPRRCRDRGGAGGAIACRKDAGPCRPTRGGARPRETPSAA